MYECACVERGGERERALAFARKHRIIVLGAGLKQCIACPLHFIDGDTKI